MNVFATVDFVPAQEFAFQRTTGQFNERQVLDLHPDYMDINRLNTALSSLVYGDLATFVMSRNTPNWAVKLCQVQQYFAQYLLYTTSQCEAHLLELTAPQTDPNLEMSLRQEINDLRNEIKHVRQKHETENIMYKLMSVRPEVVEALPTCLHCGKIFGAYNFLLAHHKRRHPGLPEPKPPVPSFTPLPQPCQCCIHEDKSPACIPEPTLPPIEDVPVKVHSNAELIPEPKDPSPVIPIQYDLPVYTESDIFAEGDNTKAQPVQPYVTFDSNMSEYYHNIRKRVHLGNMEVDRRYQELKRQYLSDFSNNSTSIS